MSGPGDDASPDGNRSDRSAIDPERRRDARPETPQTRQSDETADDWAVILHDVVTSVVAVLLVGAFLFAVSGVWPPLVAIESGSMHPNMQQNDLVFVMEETRFPAEGAVGDTGVVTYRSGGDAGHAKFGKPGDVIVYEPNGNNRTTPIIHRAMFWVEEGENWYQRANPDWVGGKDSCDELRNCPADQAGFITKGDHNVGYDQVVGSGARTGAVKPEWIIGTAEYRIPGLGWIRLRST
ncbi:S26 family signal peptidase [Halobacteriales archaeon Cl-PHB]